MPGKYGAKKCSLNGLTFDSHFERDVYLRLCVHLHPNDVLHHQSARYEPVLISEPTKRFPKWEWKCDFYVPKLQLWVEAKGVQTSDWKLLIHALDCLNPKVLDRLIVVSSEGGQRVCDKLYTVDLERFSAYLRNQVSP